MNIVFDGREFTNVEIDRAANRLGNVLRKLGVNQGDRVILQIPNCSEVFQAFQAIWKIGAIAAVPINYLVGTEEGAFIYEDCGAETVITAPDYLKIKGTVYLIKGRQDLSKAEKSTVTFLTNSGLRMLSPKLLLSISLT